MVFALMSVAGMLVGGAYAIRDAGERGRMRVRCVLSGSIEAEIGEKGVPELPNAFKWWEGERSGGSSKVADDRTEVAEKTEAAVADAARSEGVLPAASGAVGKTGAVSDEGQLVVRPGNIDSGGVGVEGGSGEEAVQMRQIRRQLARMRQQIRRRLEVAMRNARVPADARRDIRSFATQLFNRIAEVRRQAALGQIPRYQVRQEMRAAWQDFAAYVNDRLDAKHQKQFWREWQYAKNPQKRFYDMQRQMQDIQKKMNQQRRQMEKLMRRSSRGAGRKRRR
ncbi:MAG: hypothetical protein DRP63_01525 [Planctomycetota bacterium]|nr:MAG: hypothetical protein DRP63_01525 [Planctomycetota bacterium]